MFTIQISGMPYSDGSFDSPENAEKMILSQGWRKDPIDPLYDSWQHRTYSLGGYQCRIFEQNMPLNIENFKRISAKERANLVR
jgi:hypothetical protein